MPHADSLIVGHFWGWLIASYMLRWPVHGSYHNQ